MLLSSNGLKEKKKKKLKSPRSPAQKDADEQIQLADDELRFVVSSVSLVLTWR